MIVKRLRERNHWSQEQLAGFSGLSPRTIQRVEAGNPASLGTLKALASVFETDVASLAEEIHVIDKDADYWKAEPLVGRMLLPGVNRRSKELVAIEYLLVMVGIATFLAFEAPHMTPPLAFLCAYLSAKLMAHVDRKGYWQRVAVPLRDDPGHLGPRRWMV